MIDKLIYISRIVLPIYLIISIGYTFTRLGIFSKNLSEHLNKLMFNLALPVLLFLSISGSRMDAGINLPLLAICNAIVLVYFIFLYLLSIAFKMPPRKKGVFVQASFRANMAYIGIPVCVNAFGESALGPTAVTIAFVIPIYNVLAVLALTLPHQRSFRWEEMKNTLTSILKNPLIIAAVSGIVFSSLGIQIPEMALKTLQPLGKAALPLALISIGCSLNLSGIHKRLKYTFLISLLKLVAFPAFTALVLSFFFEISILTKIAVMLMGMPPAVSSYVMAQAMGGDPDLASESVTLSTLFSIVTISGWLLFLI